MSNDVSRCESFTAGGSGRNMDSVLLFAAGRHWLLVHSVNPRKTGNLLVLTSEDVVVLWRRRQRRGSSCSSSQALTGSAFLTPDLLTSQPQTPPCAPLRPPRGANKHQLLLRSVLKLCAADEKCMLRSSLGAAMLSDSARRPGSRAHLLR